jgi:hypothetical protein
VFLRGFLLISLSERNISLSSMTSPKSLLNRWLLISLLHGPDGTHFCTRLGQMGIDLLPVHGAGSFSSSIARRLHYRSCHFRRGKDGSDHLNRRLIIDGGELI